MAVLFRDYLETRRAEDRWGEGPFGTELGGTFLRWVFGFESINLFTSTSRHIQVEVPLTERGAAPTCDLPHPYVWTGQINENAADCAVWHAFEILCEEEAWCFYADQKPEVIFRFLYYGKSETIRVKHDGVNWVLTED